MFQYFMIGQLHINHNCDYRADEGLAHGRADANPEIARLGTTNTKVQISKFKCWYNDRAC